MASCSVCRDKHVVVRGQRLNWPIDIYLCSECVEKPQPEVSEDTWYNRCLYCRGRTTYSKEKLVISTGAIGCYHRGYSVTLLSGILCERCDPLVTYLKEGEYPRECCIDTDLKHYQRVINTRLWWPDALQLPPRWKLGRMDIPPMAYECVDDSVLSSVIDIIRSPLNTHNIRYFVKCIRRMIYSTRFRDTALALIPMMKYQYRYIQETVESIPPFSLLSTKPGQFCPKTLILGYLRDPTYVIVLQTENAVKSLK